MNKTKDCEMEQTNNQIKKKYTAEFKQQVLEVFRSGVYESAVACAQAYGIKEMTFYQWLRRASIIKPDKTSQELELLQLRKELARARMELDILKKATIYFASQAK